MWPQSNSYIKDSSKNLSNENMYTDIWKIVYFGILIHVLSWKTCFRYMYFRLLNRSNELKIIWQNNWCCIIWRSRRSRRTILKSQFDSALKIWVKWVIQNRPWTTFFNRSSFQQTPKADNLFHNVTWKKTPLLCI